MTNRVIKRLAMAAWRLDKVRSCAVDGYHHSSNHIEIRFIGIRLILRGDAFLSGRAILKIPRMRCE